LEEAIEGDHIMKDGYDREKVRKAGFSLYRINETDLTVKIYDAKGNWKLVERCKTKRELGRWNGIFKNDPTALRD
jgi:hypothetical protein